MTGTAARWTISRGTGLCRIPRETSTWFPPISSAAKRSRRHVPTLNQIGLFRQHDKRREDPRGTPGSLHLRARGDDDLRPFRRLGGDDLAEVLRRAHDRLASELGEARLHLGIGEGAVHFGVDLPD